MPLKKCQNNNKPGYKWGEEGKCYTYTPGNEESRNQAKQKAINQGIAMGEIEVDEGGDDNISRKYRVDKAEILDVKEHESGFITVKAAITRTGVMPYRMADGSIRRELKHPDEILSDKTVESANGIPVTNTHPPELIDTKNYDVYLRGSTHNDATVEDDKIVVTETIFDDNLIAYILSGKREQISIGFTADVEEESGEFEGNEYDAIQRNITINHIAHVEEGRAGDGVKAMLDSKKEFGIEVDADGADKMKKILDRRDHEEDDNNHQDSDKNKKGEMNMADKLNGIVGEDGFDFEDIEMLVIGDKEVEITDSVKEDLQDLRTTLKEKFDEKVDELNETIEEKNDRIEELESKIETLEGKLDAKENGDEVVNDKIEELQNKIEELEAKNDSKDVEDKVMERLELMDEARKYVEDVNPSDDPRDIKVKVIQRLDEDFDPEDKSDEYIEARYDASKDTLEMITSRSVGRNDLRTSKKKTDSKIDEKKNKRTNMRK